MNLKIYKSIPQSLYKNIEKAVRSFVSDHNKDDVSIDSDGLYSQTIESIAAATFLSNNDGSQFWMAEENGEVYCYVLSRVGKEVDNKLCFWISQAWVHPKYRGKRVVKEWLKVLKEEAKNRFCKHIVVVSSRGVDAYCRFLGDGAHLYANLLKIDL